MKKFRVYEMLSENALAKLFLPANIVVSAVIFKWSEFFIYLSKINESGCKPIPATVPFSSKISFGIYDLASNSWGFDYILPFVSVIFSIFYLPSYLAAMVVIGAMKSDYPHWCLETFDLIFVPVFSAINCGYLIFLSYLLGRMHDSYCQHKSPPENPLSIYPD